MNHLCLLLSTEVLIASLTSGYVDSAESDGDMESFMARGGRTLMSTLGTADLLMCLSRRAHAHAGVCFGCPAGIAIVLTLSPSRILPSPPSLNATLVPRDLHRQRR